MRLPASENCRTTTAAFLTSSKSYNMDNSSIDGGNAGYTPIMTGMTSAISTAPPKPHDLKLTQELEDTLKPHGVFETVEELTHRMEILSKLDALVKEWVRDLSIKKSLPPSVAAQV